MPGQCTNHVREHIIAFNRLSVDLIVRSDLGEFSKTQQVSTHWYLVQGSRGEELAWIPFAVDSVSWCCPRSSDLAPFVFLGGPVSSRACGRRGVAATASSTRSSMTTDLLIHRVQHRRDVGRAPPRWARQRSSSSRFMSCSGPGSAAVRAVGHAGYGESLHAVSPFWSTLGLVRVVTQHNRTGS